MTWSDKGELIAQGELKTLSRSSFFFPGPAGDEVKSSRSVIIKDKDLNEVNRIMLNDADFNLTHFSEYENYIIVAKGNVLAAPWILNTQVLSLNGGTLHLSKLNSQPDCFNLEKDIYKTYFPAFVPSPNGQLILKAYQNEDCSVEIDFLDAESGFITANNISAPVIYDAQVAWTVEGNVMVQGWSDEGGAISWLVKTDGNITEFNNKAFDDECFVPATASYYVSQSLDVVPPYTYRDPEVLSFDDIKDGIEKSENGYFYSSSFLLDPLNVFGCQSIQSFL